MNTRLDIILFGASGITGKYCIRALNNFTSQTGSERQPLTWGIAGRSPTKLKKALDYWEERLGKEANLKNIPIVLADVNNYDSLTKMTASARVVVNCCGPYRFYGEPVIKACIETGTHQVDVCGEPEYMELVQLKYHELAKEKGVYIVSSCGFESIACDLGVLFLEQNFEGTLNSVETCLKMSNHSASNSNNMINVGTWESAIYGVSNAAKLKEIRSKLNLKKLPQFLPKLETRPENTNSDLADGSYLVPNPTCDRSVIFRTRTHLFEKKNMRPVQLQTYFSVDTRSGLFVLAFYRRLFEFLVEHEFGRKLLSKFPDLFSNGYVTRAENLSEEKLEKTKYILSILGTGWDLNAAKADNHNYKELPSKTICASVEGYNPAYGVASNAVVLSAITILIESDKLPSRGGVYTPGAAFIDTSMIEQLHINNVIRFNIKSKL